MKKIAFAFCLLLILFSACSEDPVETVFMERFQNGRFPVAEFNGIKDTYLYIGNPTSNWDATEILQVGSSSYQSHIIMKFIISSGYLPDTIKIKKAFLSLRLYQAYTATFYEAGDLEAYPLTSDWDQTSATWNTGSAAWSGGDYDSSRCVGKVSIEDTDTLTFDLDTAIVKEWLTKSYDSYGILIKYNNNYNETDYLWFRDSECPFTNYRPLLTVYYTL